VVRKEKDIRWLPISEKNAGELTDTRKSSCSQLLFHFITFIDIEIPKRILTGYTKPVISIV
jgi:hypothetical protein